MSIVESPGVDIDRTGMTIAAGLADARLVLTLTAMTPNQLPPHVGPRRTIDWLIVVSLAALPLLHALFSITGWAEDVGRLATHLSLTVIVTAIWVTVVGLSRQRPVVTLVLAGVIAAIVTTALNLLVPAVRTGDMRNVLDGFGVVAALLVTVALFSGWGALAGLLAAGLQRMRARARADAA